MVVSTDRPEATAARDAPAPRWAVTSRRPSTGRPSRPAARRADQAWLSPWKPNRRRSHRSRHSRGMAYVVAKGGMSWWNDVSKQATAGRPGRRVPRARTASRLWGLCSGARSPSVSSSASLPSSSSTGPGNAVPPWTTRCPAASGSGTPSRKSARAAGSPAASGRSRSAEPTTASRSSRSRSLRLLEPALTTRMCIRPPCQTGGCRMPDAGRRRWPVSEVGARGPRPGPTGGCRPESAPGRAAGPPSPGCRDGPGRSPARPGRLRRPPGRPGRPAARRSPG